MTQKYAFQGYDAEKMARVIGKDLPVSSKHCIELCSFIRGRKLERAKELLEEVLRMERPVSFKRFTEGAGHKHGMASGKYPLKATAELLMLLNSVEANAQQKGLNTSALTIIHACANRASRPHHYGRIRGIKAKRTHMEIVVAEREEKESKKKETKKEQKSESKEKPKGENK